MRLQGLPSLAAILAGCLCVPAARAAGGGSAGEGGLQEVVIEGRPRIRMTWDKPGSIPAPDPDKPVADWLAQRFVTSKFEDRFAVALPLLLPERIESDLALSPWRRRLTEPPVLYVALRAASRPRVSRWRLTITDDKGKAFRVIKGRGSLPEFIAWDGLGDSREPLRVGHPYAYSLSMTDPDGVPAYVSGKTVRLASYVHETSKALRIAATHEALFEPGRGLSPKGRELLAEARDLIRRREAWDIEVRSYGEDADLALRQAEAGGRFLEGSLHLAEGALRTRGLPADAGGYLRTEVLAQ